MLGPRLFRSRWTALCWAGGVLWAACGVARDAPHGAGATPAAATDATGATVTPADLDALANAGTR